MDPHNTEIVQKLATLPAQKQDQVATATGPSKQDGGDGSGQVMVVVGAIAIGYGSRESIFESIAEKRMEVQKHSQTLVVFPG
ncbi:hypothetical protein LTR56_002093 [Elasticomyces elasticus]|nr:hypothetical protein LTR22_012235 [Elasticomyces elasticus]KAK3658236.1 hypothetical protein LTR56_002093 [Elasticomyces elasticus]KAK4919515.1 hypothetical protein LTR49_012893 [Elasticomyces elasticus]KAK5764121.1 hypothetical protein LTS12_005815 [Elasticomyces elasticus]